MTPGDIIADKYRIERLLGSGGFGEVWVATQLGLNRQVAVKTLTSFGHAEAQRFEREAQALIRLDHPNCVQLFDFGTADGRRYLVMPVIDGAPLDAWLSGAPPLAQRLRVARHICSALGAAHAQGIVHRDLKPANVMIAPTPDGPHAIVLDFGIAKLADAPTLDITKTGEVFGTPGYMSPEQLRASGDVGPATDLYALGVILYEMFEGRPPFTGGSMLELAMQHMQVEPPPMTAELPEHLRVLVAQLLAKAPQDRPNTAQVLHRLTAEHAEKPRNPVSRPPHAYDVPAASPSRTWLRLAAGVAMLVALAVVAAFAIGRDEPQTPKPPDHIPRPNPLGDKPAVPDPPESIVQPIDLGVIRCPKPIPHPQDFEFRFRPPEGYLQTEQSALLVIVHDFSQSGHGIISSPRLIQFADQRGYVVVAPDDGADQHVWSQGEDDAVVRRAIEVSLDRFCIDPRRVFLLGLGNGGDPVYEIGVQDEGITAIVTSGYRFDEGENRKNGAYRPPYLFTNPMQDKMAPRDGGSWMGGQPKMALRDHERTLLDQWGCSDFAAPPNGECARPTCDSPIEVCRYWGGRLWPEFTSTDVAEVAHTLFGSRPTENDYFLQAFEFFDRHDPGSSKAEDPPDDVEGVRHSPAP